MSICPTVLVIDDEKNTRDGIVQYLEGLDYDVLTAENGREGWELVEKEKPDLVLTDVRMPEITGTELLEKIKGNYPNIQVVLLTAYGSVEDAVKAMKKGAFYYLTKPVNLDELEFLTKKALAAGSLQKENLELKKELIEHKYSAGDILTNSPKMIETLKTVDQIAKAHSTVLIEGESGTGKELIAHRIHNLSSRKIKPFIPVHCAALTETLLASELFGHEKGAFTGANERKIGRFERAHEGTLFLDEIGEISAETQVKLLRVLQEGEFERVGGTRTLKIDVRLICATNKNLLEEVKAGRFREDLYYRLNVIYLQVPPLRDRRNDIPLLANHFFKHFATLNGKKITEIKPNTYTNLQNYDWPGNVRELKNIIERMVVLSTTPIIDETLVPIGLHSTEQNHQTSGEISPSIEQHNLANMEKEFIKKTLLETKGNKSLAAKQLGISRRTLYRKLEEYEIPEN